ncbi:TIGR03083 family protein [Micromonospora rhizosphaerae]|uniref:TIGR03083 family protein n=1 Tax=Micromonospora rhizosphaerae TaxID=568872 RepID=A0A1C6RGH3_9ACTN|nr:maleylpyruvate isomerase family mycothiol-dependent enzyme [Micromonospora rhizosphaerae]SCL16282.1 TIGR03083 family protein [Micromonospora rhizosphaerae]
MTELDDSIAAWRESLESVLVIGETLADSDWNSPTECPGWSVKDVYSHLIGGELWMAAGHPRPERGIAHIADEPVAARRHTSPPKVLDELREVYRQRCAQTAEVPPDPEQPAFTAWGQPVPLGTLWRHRAFDVWVHEQDIRRAVGRPGNLDSPGARIACGQFISALPVVVAKRAGAPSGSVVRFSVAGPIAFDHSVLVGDDRRGRLVSGNSEPVTSLLSMDWESFARLSCGRILPHHADVTVAGDTGLGGQILGHLSITP